MRSSRITDLRLHEVPQAARGTLGRTRYLSLVSQTPSHCVRSRLVSRLLETRCAISTALRHGSRRSFGESERHAWRGDRKQVSNLFIPIVLHSVSRAAPGERCGRARGPARGCGPRARRLSRPSQLRTPAFGF
eukprot:3181132-Prymnesium_polylepis.1